MQIQNVVKQQFGKAGHLHDDGLKRRLSANDWMQQNKQGLQVEGQISYDPNMRAHQNRSHLSQQPGMLRAGVHSNQSAHVPKHHSGLPLSAIQGAGMNPTRTENAKQFNTIGVLEAQAKTSRNQKPMFSQRNG